MKRWSNYYEVSLRRFMYICLFVIYIVQQGGTPLVDSTQSFRSLGSYFTSDVWRGRGPSATAVGGPYLQCLANERETTRVIMFVYKSARKESTCERTRQSKGRSENFARSSNATMRVIWMLRREDGLRSLSFSADTHIDGCVYCMLFVTLVLPRK